MSFGSHSKPATRMLDESFPGRACVPPDRRGSLHDDFSLIRLAAMNPV